MQGLKVLGGLLGWTRLSDEWLASVALPLRDGEAARQSVITAAARTRRFADGEEPAPIVPDAAGIVRFELQGIVYAVATELLSLPATEGALDAAPALLAAALERAQASAVGEEHPVGAVLASPEGGAAAPAQLLQWSEQLRLGSLTHSLAYRVDEERGAFFLARSPHFP